MFLAIAVRPTKVVTISSPTSDVNLYTTAGSPSYPGNVLCFINAALTSSANTIPALRTGTGWSPGNFIYVENTSTITGRTVSATGAGGTGGNGQYGSGLPGSAGAIGGQGGTAFKADIISGVTIVAKNTGTISGGTGGPGGGGGGGASGGYNTGEYIGGSKGDTYPAGPDFYYGGGGGGGAGTPGGSGGTGGGGGAAGGPSNGGSGGTSPGGGLGGTGGSLGNAGGGGTFVNSPGWGGSYGGAGGAAGSTGVRGNAVVGNTSIVWVATGTLTGRKS